MLMRLIRGTGPRGLGGIYPRLVVENDDGDGFGEIVRPLLGLRRRELEQYLKEIKQPWQEDSSNAEKKFTRNRVRRLVLPLLEREFNPAVVESFAELAEIARDEEDYWENEVSGWLGTVVQWSEPEWAGENNNPQEPGLVQIGPATGVSILEESPGKSQSIAEKPRTNAADGGGQGILRLSENDGNLPAEESGPAAVSASLSRPWLVTESKAVQRRVIKAIGKQVGLPLEFKHIEEILRFAGEEGPAGKELSLPLGWKVAREPEAMIFLTPDLLRQERIPDYEYLMTLPGRISVPEIGVVIEALLPWPDSALEPSAAEYNSQQLLQADLLTSPLTVRNWRPGDRFWPAHTKAPKKVKELLQERHVPQPQRRFWPVVLSRDEIVWMRGFPVPAKFRIHPGQSAVLIRETFTEADETTI